MPVVQQVFRLGNSHKICAKYCAKCVVQHGSDPCAGGSHHWPCLRDRRCSICSAPSESNERTGFHRACRQPGRKSDMLGICAGAGRRLVVLACHSCPRSTTASSVMGWSHVRLCKVRPQCSRTSSCVPKERRRASLGMKCRLHHRHHFKRDTSWHRLHHIMRSAAECQHEGSSSILTWHSSFSRSCADFHSLSSIGCEAVYSSLQRRLRAATGAAFWKRCRQCDLKEGRRRHR